MKNEAVSGKLKKIGATASKNGTNQTMNQLENITKQQDAG